jgi:hypothetical protein
MVLTVFMFTLTLYTAVAVSVYRKMYGGGEW